MKIKVVEYNPEEAGSIRFGNKFKITQLEDEEILKISQLSPISINMDPRSCGLSSFQWKPIQLGSAMKWTFILKSDKNGLLNFGELENIELLFESKEDAEKYQKFILDQFENEIQRIGRLNNVLGKEKIYEINAEEGLKKIYEGAEKLLDKNSVEYKEIIEKNREAWKRLADL
ncbi:MAG: hypothetical protein EHM58_11865 [Ignavibacteriae bacterium]|nr:MAG: hypothetical protein EHM58_11865 [Ignavibacteriota bacterium]